MLVTGRSGSVTWGICDICIHIYIYTYLYNIYVISFYNAKKDPKKIGWSTSSSNYRHIYHKSHFFSSCRPTYLSSGPFDMWWKSAPWQLEEGVAEGMRLTVQDTSQLRERRCWFSCTVVTVRKREFFWSCHRDWSMKHQQTSWFFMGIYPLVN